MTIKLAKRTEQVGIILAKRGLTKVPPVRVGAQFDVSGSAEHFYTSGVMQETIDRLIPVAMKFDDNGELDAWLFHHGVLPQLPTITESDEGTYVNSTILKQRGLWGSTNYAPALSEAVNFYFGASAQATPVKKSFSFGGMFGGKKEASLSTATSQPASKLPAMVLFLTDGSNSDPREAEQVFASAERNNTPVYFNMIGIGDASYFRFIEEMADKYGNVGFTNMNDLTMTDDQLYDKIVNQEFVDWVKQFAV